MDGCLGLVERIDSWVSTRLLAFLIPVLDGLVSLSGATLSCRHPGAPAVIGLTRIYCNQGESFLLVDIATEDASTTAEELVKEGWEIEAEIPV